MRALLHRAVAVVVVLVAATVPGLSQGVGLVSGRVTDERGVPLKDAVVTLSGPGILGTHEQVTNDEGRYWFRAVPGNQPLVLTAHAADRVSMRYQGHTARRDGVVHVDFTLRSPGEHEILVLMEDGVPYHQVAMEGAMSTMPGRASTLMVRDTGSDTARALRELLGQKPSAVLAIGELAAKLARRHIQDVPIVYAMVPAPLDSDLTTRNMCGVPLNGGFEIQLEHLRHVLPGARRVGTVYDPARLGSCLGPLRDAAAAAGLDLAAVHVHGDDPGDMAAALAELREADIDAFLLLLDPHTVDAGRFQQITAFVASEDLVLAVPDQSLVSPGKVFSFSPGFWEQGAYAGTLVRRIVEGKTQPLHIGMAYPAGDETDRVSARLQPRDPSEVLP